ncbi:GNAT family N-acetyltransferase [Arcanobacterium canis]
MKIERVKDDIVGLRRTWVIRHDVFVDEQNWPVEEEVDQFDHDPRTTHVIAVSDEGEDLATARIIFEEPGRVRITRVAVSSHVRGDGVGKELMTGVAKIALEDYAVDGQVHIVLAAQEHAVPFYETLGYTRAEGGYEYVGIKHFEMEQTLTA